MEGNKLYRVNLPGFVVWHCIIEPSRENCANHSVGTVDWKPVPRYKLRH
jgi:hypothetical protein